MDIYNFFLDPNDRAIGTKNGIDLYDGDAAKIICNTDFKTVLIIASNMQPEIIRMGADVTIKGDPYPTATTDNMKAIRDALRTVFLKANSGSGGSGAFADLTGSPSDNTALASALGAKASLSGAEILTNKTIDGGDNTLQNIPVSAISANDVQEYDPDSAGMAVETIAALDALNLANTGKRLVEITATSDAGIYFHTGTVLKKFTTSDVALPTVGIESVLEDGNTLGWYKSDEAATITKDGSNRVTQWNDFLASGRNLIASIGDQMNFAPTLTANGVSFDGVYNYLETGAVALNQPFFLYMVVRVSSTTGEYSSLTAGASVYDIAADARLLMNMGANGPNNIGLVLDQFIIIRMLFNGASSKSIINGLTAVTGNPGNQNFTKITLGAAGAYSASSKIDVKEFIVRKISDSSQNETAIYNYLKTKHSL